MNVSVVIPVFNEERHIQSVLRGLFTQDWKQPFEIIIVDGKSTDRTVPRIQEMISMAPEGIDVRVLSNPERHIPRSLNMAIEAARGEIILRLDGHTVPPPDFLTRSVQSLTSINFNGIVGGRCNIQPGAPTLMARGIARALAHPLGSGNALYRSFDSNRAEPKQRVVVDTVPFGCFTKKLWIELGGYDEELLSAEDYDFAFRARIRGASVVLDPLLVLSYFARPSLKALAEQYFRYGSWTARLLKKHRRVSAARKLVPLLLVTSTLVLTFISPVIGVVWVSFYLLSLSLVIVWHSLRQRYTVREALTMLAALVITHWSYGLGNIAGFLSRRKTDHRSTGVATVTPK